jgi:hypothetical protein
MLNQGLFFIIFVYDYIKKNKTFYQLKDSSDKTPISKIRIAATEKDKIDIEMLRKNNLQ